MINSNLRLTGAAAAVLALFSTQTLAAEMDHSQHQGHGQHDTGMAQHMHHHHGAGSWMFEYRYMKMNMSGLLDGTDEVDSADISGAMMPGPTLAMGKEYLMAPTTMDMSMHMLMAMYGISPRLSAMAMFNYVQNDMDMVMHMPMMGTAMYGTMKTEGVGDTSLGLMFRATPNWSFNLNLSIPTGSVEEDVTTTMSTPNGMMTNTMSGRAPYPMQLGSGSFEIEPSVTYNRDTATTNHGFQAAYSYVTGENDAGYTLGDRIDATAWSKYKVGGTQLSARLYYANWGEIDGNDSNIMAMMSPLANPANSGGTRVDAYLGISAMDDKGMMLGVEVGVPLHQDLNGIQMKTTSIVSASIQYMF